MKIKCVIYIPAFAALAVCYLSSSLALADVSNGKKIYELTCDKCHGLTGKGDGVVAPMLAVKPASFADGKIFTDKENLDMSPDDRMAKVIRSGSESIGRSKLMQAYSSFTDAEIKDIILYLKSLSQTTKGVGKGKGKH